MGIHKSHLDLSVEKSLKVGGLDARHQGQRVGQVAAHAGVARPPAGEHIVNV